MSVVNFIGGERVAPSGSRSYRAVNPARTEDLIAEYQLSDVADVDAAVGAARQAASAWAAQTPSARGEILRKAAEIIRARVEPIAQQMTREVGKPLEESRGETLYSARVLEFYAAEGLRFGGENLPSGRPGVFAYTTRKPIGSVGLITPWNFPMSIAAWKIGPALVTGNTAVWKPCLQAPFTSLALVEAFAEAGLPAGVLNLVHGDGFDVGQAIVDHPGLSGISFTGSQKVGFAVHQSASNRRAKVQCELGGKNPLVVLDDADLDAAVTTAIEGAFRNAGQKCTATSRVILAARHQGRLHHQVRGARRRAQRRRSVRPREFRRSGGGREAVREDRRLHPHRSEGRGNAAVRRRHQEEHRRLFRRADGVRRCHARHDGGPR